MQSQFQELEKKNALLLQQIKLADEDSQKVRQESTKVIEQCDLTMNSIGEVVSYFERELFQLATLHQADEVAKPFVQDMSVWMKWGPAKMQVLEQKIQDSETNNKDLYELGLYCYNIQSLIDKGPKMLQDYCSALDKSQTTASQVIFEWNNLMREVQKMREKVSIKMEAALKSTKYSEAGHEQQQEEDPFPAHDDEMQIEAHESRMNNLHEIGRKGSGSVGSGSEGGSRKSTELAGAAVGEFVSAGVIANQSSPTGPVKSLFLGDGMGESSIPKAHEKKGRKGNAIIVREMVESADGKTTKVGKTTEVVKKFESPSSRQFVDKHLKLQYQSDNNVLSKMCKAMKTAKEQEKYVHLLLLRPAFHRSYYIQSKDAHRISNEDQVIEVVVNDMVPEGGSAHGKCDEKEEDSAYEDLTRDRIGNVKPSKKRRDILDKTKFDLGGSFTEFAGQWLSAYEYCAKSDETLPQILKKFELTSVKTLVLSLNKDLDVKLETNMWRTGKLKKGTILNLPGDRVADDLKQFVPENELTAAENNQRQGNKSSGKAKRGK